MLVGGPVGWRDQRKAPWLWQASRWAGETMARCCAALTALDLYKREQSTPSKNSQRYDALSSGPWQTLRQTILRAWPARHFLISGAGGALECYLPVVLDSVL